MATEMCFTNCVVLCLGAQWSESLYEVRNMLLERTHIKMLDCKYDYNRVQLFNYSLDKPCCLKVLMGKKTTSTQSQATDTGHCYTKAPILV